MKKILLILLFVLTSFLAFAGGTKEEVKEDSQVVKFGVDSTWPPMEFINTDTSEIVGFTIDLVKAIGREEGFTPEFQTVAWDGIFAGLLKGDYDAVSSSVTITEERKKNMAFSDPYFNAGQILAINKNDKGKYTSLADLVGEEVGAQIGTVGADEISKVDGVILKTYDALGPAIEELYNGTIMGIVADTSLVADYLLKNPKYEGEFVTVGEPMTSEEYGFVFDPANSELRETMNSGLAKVKESGEYETIYAKWIN